MNLLSRSVQSLCRDQDAIRALFGKFAPSSSRRFPTDICSNVCVRAFVKVYFKDRKKYIWDIYIVCVWVVFEVGVSVLHYARGDFSGNGMRTHCRGLVLVRMCRHQHAINLYVPFILKSTRFFVVGRIETQNDTRHRDNEFLKMNCFACGLMVCVEAMCLA